MPPTSTNDPYFNALAQQAKARIPALGSVCSEDDGAYMALGDVERFFFDPARTTEERVQVLSFINHSLEIGGKETETAIILELFMSVYYYNEPFTSLLQKYLSPPAWSLFLTHRELERKRGFYTITPDGESRPYVKVS